MLFITEEDVVNSWNRSRSSCYSTDDMTKSEPEDPGPCMHVFATILRNLKKRQLMPDNAK